MAATDRKRPRLLIFSFSKIHTDARVMRQINEFVDDYEITTCGAGPHPHPGVVEHIELRKGNPRWIRHIQGVLLNLKLHRLAYLMTPQVRESLRRLRRKRFDVALANDLPAAGVVARVVPGDRTHLDLHEYWLGLHDNLEGWNRLRKPYYAWMLRTYATRAAAHTTVNRAIAERYEREFGFSSEVVTNAGLLQTLEPRPVGSTIRLVHSGGVNPGRRIDVMMRAVAASSNDVSLDLYLMGEGTGPRRELEQLARELGDRITVLPPVSQTELVPTLNQYDVGIHILAPTCTNNALALPNKFFDFVQARLAMVTGPTEAMVEILREYSLGEVTESFEQAAITKVLDGLTPERVAEYKLSADRAAADLSGERQVQVWRREIDRLAARTSAPAV